MKVDRNEVRTGAALLMVLGVGAWVGQGRRRPGRAGAADGIKAKLPFTLSKELTGIVSPVDAEGAPDYLAALNERYGKGVKPEDNLFVGWVEMTGGADRFMPPEVADKMAKIAGAKTGDRTVMLQEYQPYLQQKKNLSREEVRGKYLRFFVLQKTPWTAEEDPMLAEYLKAMEEPLNRMVAISGRMRWWPPLISVDGRSMYHAEAPAVGQLYIGAMTLAARSTLRAKAGDFDGFLKDTTAVMRMGRVLMQAMSLGERQIALEIEMAGVQAIGAAVGSGKLTAGQCAAITEMLAALPPVTNVDEAVDITDRYQQLDYAVIFTMGSEKVFTFPGQGDIDRSAVDWALVLKRVNQSIDKRLDVMRGPTEELIKKVEAYLGDDTRFQEDRHDAQPGELRRKNGESKAAYSERIAAWISQLPTEDEWQVTEMWRREALMDGEMLRALLAAAEFRAKEGKWPELLRDLVPAYLKSIPKDMYSEFGHYDVSYDAAATGAHITSTGRPKRGAIVIGAGE